MAENNCELNQDDIIINDQDGLPNVHPNLLAEATVDSPDRTTDDEFEDLPTSLIVTNIHDDVFINPDRKTELEELFRMYDSEVTFQWLRSFKRLRVNFQTPLAAASARIQLHQYPIKESVITCYFAQPVTPVKNSSLQPPAPFKQFLISPPSSPPLDWEPRPEGSLPEVPPLKEVPYISFHYDTNEESNLTNICRQFGDVIHISPVQITSLLERPGAILVEWAISENEDHFVDVQDYHLQWAFGTVNNLESNFHTCYIGPNLQYLVKDLNLNQNYSFRVRCKYEGDTQWSPWSLPQVCQTTIKSFSWVETDNFTLTNDNKIALSLLNTTSFVCSRRIEFNVGYSIEFTRQMEVFLVLV
ncbi:uncharacterized protein LOC116162658 isoform X2 [Photinus pyralis]|uniref:uncharacterized protein LOC116162657 isoform X2 n=1 Tax=Photinus pyralis TaxID=7054 RepID=UPI00126777FD|nr:uncharacterized protein LOC116162657 isoform X2 [Photinus pyralis]XP_031332176.1 uncharacterized protein LOC116162658 isoform X2 [Photinus pyralis]